MKVPYGPATLMEEALPIGRYLSCRTRGGLIEWMVLGGGQRRTLDKSLRCVVPIPILPRLKTTEQGMARFPGMSRGMLARGGITAADVPTFCASPQVQPPPTGLEALDTTRAAWGNVGIYLFVSHWPSLRSRG